MSNIMQQRGFSLVELSIVLIIIGLLIAGVSSGSKLIKQARINSLINELTEFKGAFNIFEQIYDQLPGDINNAYDFFGSVNSCTNNNVNIDAQGCNGDADGIIDFWVESYRANQHLESAGFITGGYDGYDDRMVSKVFNGNEYHALLLCSNMGHTDMGTHCTQFGGNDQGNNAGLIAKDQYFIDKKLDDGMPLSGFIRFRIVTVVASGNTVTTTSCGDSTGYHTSLTYEGCNLLMSVDR